MLLATVLLTSCSSVPASKSEPSEAASSVYQLETPSYGADDKLTVQIPQALIDVAPETESLLSTSVQVTAHELTSAKYCAVDLVISWAEGAIDQLKNSGSATFTKGDTKTDVERVAYSLTGKPFKYDNGIVNGGVATMMAELNPSEPQPGFYAAADYGTLTLVRECAESPTDDNKYTTLEFNFQMAASGSLNTFASFDMTVMKSGTLTVVEKKVNDYVLDSNGNWLAD